MTHQELIAIRMLLEALPEPRKWTTSYEYAMRAVERELRLKNVEADLRKNDVSGNQMDGD